MNKNKSFDQPAAGILAVTELQGHLLYAYLVATRQTGVWVREQIQVEVSVLWREVVGHFGIRPEADRHCSVNCRRLIPQNRT